MELFLKKCIISLFIRYVINFSCTYICNRTKIMLEIIYYLIFYFKKVDELIITLKN